MIYNWSLTSRSLAWKLFSTKLAFFIDTLQQSQKCAPQSTRRTAVLHWRSTPLQEYSPQTAALLKERFQVWYLKRKFSFLSRTKRTLRTYHPLYPLGVNIKHTARVLPPSNTMHAWLNYALRVMQNYSHWHLKDCILCLGDCIDLWAIALAFGWLHWTFKVIIFALERLHCFKFENYRIVYMSGCISS